MNVYQKLNAARDLFHKASLKKSGHNKFAGYSYFELSDFVVPALSIFSTVGLTSVISFSADTAIMRIINVEKPEESIEITSPMAEANLKGCHPIQNLGAVQSYIRRYLWVTALEIIEHDALDSSEPLKNDGNAASKAKKTEAPVIPALPSVDIPEDEQRSLTNLSLEMIDLFNENRAEDMYTHLQEQNLDSDQKVYLWSKLPSKVRTFISAKQKK